MLDQMLHTKWYVKWKTLTTQKWKEKWFFPYFQDKGWKFYGVEKWQCSDNRILERKRTFVKRNEKRGFEVLQGQDK